MKIGDSPPVMPPSGSAPDAVDGDRKGAVDSAFAPALEGARAPGGAEGGAPTPVSDLTAIASEVDSGRLSPSEAVRQVVDQVLAAQLPQDASPELRARVRALVEATLETDPLLSGLVKRLGGRA